MTKVWSKMHISILLKWGTIAQGVRNFYDKTVNNVLDFQKVKMLIKGTLGEMI